MVSDRSVHVSQSFAWLNCSLCSFLVFWPGWRQLACLSCVMAKVGLFFFSSLTLFHCIYVHNLFIIPVGGCWIVLRPDLEKIYTKQIFDFKQASSRIYRYFLNFNKKTAILTFLFSAELGNCLLSMRELAFSHAPMLCMWRDTCILSLNSVRGYFFLRTISIFTP